MPEQVRRELELRTDGRALLITSRREQTGFGRFLGRWSRKGAKAEVWVTSLRGLELGSSARAQLVDSITTPSLRMILSGASTLTGLRLSAGKFLFSSAGASVASGRVSVDEACQLELEGASTLRLEGHVDDLKLELKGASTLKAPELQGRLGGAERCLDSAYRRDGGPQLCPLGGLAPQLPRASCPWRTLGDGRQQRLRALSPLRIAPLLPS